MGWQSILGQNFLLRHHTLCRSNDRAGNIAWNLWVDSNDTKGDKLDKQLRLMLFPASVEDLAATLHSYSSCKIAHTMNVIIRSVLLSHFHRRWKIPKLIKTTRQTVSHWQLCQSSIPHHRKDGHISRSMRWFLSVFVWQLCKNQISSSWSS